MGLATAKIVGRDHVVVLCDVRQDRLDTAAATLNDLGMTSTAVNCDVTDRHAVVAVLASLRVLRRGAPRPDLTDDPVVTDEA